MQILAVPRIVFNDYMKTKKVSQDNVNEFTDAFLISINNTVDDVRPYFEEDRENLKVMFFDDVEKDMTTPNLKVPDEVHHIKAMTKEQAIELFTFIKANKDKKICVVHCTAGVSRSGAVASFINDYVSGDWEQFKRDNSSIQPNAHVYRLLHDVWYEDHAYPGKEKYPVI